jgi:hypothetical protein
MRKLRMAAAAGWPILAFNPGPAAPADYIEQERCLAIFNIAIAVPAPEDPEETWPLMLKQTVLVQAYDALEPVVHARAGLTAEQKEEGAETFEDEQRHWLDRYGEASDTGSQDLVVQALSDEVDRCLPLAHK